MMDDFPTPDMAITHIQLADFINRTRYGLLSPTTLSPARQPAAEGSSDQPANIGNGEDGLKFSTAGNQQSNIDGSNRCTKCQSIQHVMRGQLSGYQPTTGEAKDESCDGTDPVAHVLCIDLSSFRI